MITVKSRPLRSTVKITVPFILVPLLAVGGTLVFRTEKYLIVSMAVAVFSLLLFSVSFERKSTGERRLAVSAVMTALSVAGRFIPVFKPVASLVIITGVCLGSETGFLTGAMTAFLSNFCFGQGPWTSFQMLAWGLIGFMAGVFSKVLRKNRYVLIAYGFLCGIAYSFIMDIWTVLWYSGRFDPKLYLSALLSAVPYTVSYAVSNAVYLYFISDSFIRKLSRIKTKYRI